uniref:Uncharacterized protein n=1 Tax=Anguilla anguilla TaxID=7936 RepID=A0A0E9PHA8_ANGAN
MTLAKMSAFLRTVSCVLMAFFHKHMDGVSGGGGGDTIWDPAGCDPIPVFCHR